MKKFFIFFSLNYRKFLRNLAARCGHRALRLKTQNNLKIPFIKSMVTKMKSKKKKHFKNHYIIITLVFILIALGLCLHFALPSEYVPSKDPYVCLDAGHGADDVGAINGSRYEKDDDLRLTLAVRDKLEEMGIKTLLTREDDSDVTLEDRCKIANKNGCNLFVCIHRNSAESKDAQGVEAWIARSPKGKEKALAEDLLKNICTVTGQQNRGVKKGYRDATSRDFYINADTDMPSLLLEIGFITNAEDNAAFDGKLDTTAETIAKTIYDYYFA